MLNRVLSQSIPSVIFAAALSCVLATNAIAQPTVEREIGAFNAISGTTAEKWVRIANAHGVEVYVRSWRDDYFGLRFRNTSSEHRKAEYDYRLTCEKGGTASAHGGTSVLYPGDDDLGEARQINCGKDDDGFYKKTLSLSLHITVYARGQAGETSANSNDKTELQGRIADGRRRAQNLSLRSSRAAGMDGVRQDARVLVTRYDDISRRVPGASESELASLDNVASNFEGQLDRLEAKADELDGGATGGESATDPAARTSTNEKAKEVGSIFFGLIDMDVGEGPLRNEFAWQIGMPSYNAETTIGTNRGEGIALQIGMRVVRSLDERSRFRIDTRAVGAWGFTMTGLGGVVIDTTATFTGEDDNLHMNQSIAQGSAQFWLWNLGLGALFDYRRVTGSNPRDQSIAQSQKSVLPMISLGSKHDRSGYFILSGYSNAFQADQRIKMNGGSFEFGMGGLLFSVDYLDRVINQHASINHDTNIRIMAGARIPY